jgi:uncharacterized protein (DUF885 family)
VTPAERLGRLDDDYFSLIHAVDPFNATELGVPGFDALVPDPSRSGAASAAARIGAIEQRLSDLDADGLDEPARVDAAVLGHLAWAARSDLEHGLWEANASAGGYVAPVATMFQAVPTAVLGDDDAAAASYLERLSALPRFVDAVTARYRQAKADGRHSTRVGIGQLSESLSGHLAKDITADSLAAPAGLAAGARGPAADIVTGQVRPALRRLLACLEDELLPAARPDDQVGIRFVPGGADGYLAAVRRHTTTDRTPEQIHQTGLDALEALRAEWAELGGRVLGETQLPEIFARLRADPGLRFSSSAEIVAVVSGALERAEAARDQWFPAYDIPGCVIEEIDPVEAGNAALAYYRGPAAGPAGTEGARPGAHCVLTAEPQERFRYEYEALAFHESTPGHHLQIASAQTLPLPAYRRFLDAEVCGYVEGWGLYCERLADEMGLYTSDVQRLGMLSFDALRACRLVVDTGMHYYGWPREKAVDFMYSNTATTRANVRNEIDRYIGWPGQALAYMTGRDEIRRLRGAAQDALGSRFDVRAFHGTVLGHGAVPLSVLDQVVTRWVAGQRPVS